MTPATPDETLLATHAAYIANDRNQTATAKALGVSRETVQRHIRQAAERGLLGTEPVLPGYAIKSIASKTADGVWIKQTKAPGEEYEPPASQKLQAQSVLTDADNRVLLTWHKTKDTPSAIDLAETLKNAFKDYEPVARVTEPPAFVDKDLLNFIPCNDWHVGMFSWVRETGQNWDLRIAERVIGRGIEDAISRTPNAGTAIVLGGGDLTHADNNNNQTARSANKLDVEGRHQKVVETAGRLMARTIDAALKRNDRVVVRNLKGNHDQETAPSIAWFLHAWYRNEPRVTVDLDQSLFFWFPFGKVFIGATHGHTVKLAEMAQIMAHRRAEDWGKTQFRYVHGFHVHHKSKYVTEGGGVVSESHQAPIPQDAWHHESGFLSGRSLQTITYHANYGEIGRVRVAMLDAANDNEQRRAVA